jgi:hypothetical protein
MIIVDIEHLSVKTHASAQGLEIWNRPKLLGELAKASGRWQVKAARVREGETGHIQICRIPESVDFFQG